jgi:hypothetical protein
LWNKAGVDEQSMDTAATSWNPYFDVAAFLPTDGVGGAPTVALAQNLTNPLDGSADLLLTKDAVNRQGQGFSLDFNLSPANVYDPITIKFKYKTSANFVSGDIGVYIYDVTNSILIQPVSSTVNLSASQVSTFSTLWLPNSTSQSYRLIFHIASTNALAWTANFVNFEISPQVQFQSAAIGPTISVPVVNQQAYALGGTPPVVGSVNLSGTYQRVGNLMHFKGSGSFSVTTVNTPCKFGVVIPDGLTSSNQPGVGSGSFQIAQGALNGNNTGSFLVGMVSGINMIGPITTGNTVNALGGWNLTWDVWLQIDQWTVSVNMATDFTEYASNTCAEGNSLSSLYANPSFFQKGLQGSSIPSIVPASAGATYTTYICQFDRAVQPSDKVFLEVQFSGGNWRNASDVFPYCLNNGTTYGFTISDYPTDTTKRSVAVNFANGGAYPGATFGSAGLPWSSYTNYKWRVRKVSNGNMAETIPTVPPGFVYRQGLNDGSPATMWPQYTWNDVTWEELGCAMRMGTDIGGSSYQSGAPAQITVVIIGGVPSFTVISGGSGYLSGGSGSLSATLTGPCSTQWTGNLTIVNGAVTAVATTVAGAGYTPGGALFFDSWYRKPDTLENHTHTVALVAAQVKVGTDGGTNGPASGPSSGIQALAGNGAARFSPETTGPYFIGRKWRRQ